MALPLGRLPLAAAKDASCFAVFFGGKVMSSAVVSSGPRGARINARYDANVSLRTFSIEFDIIAVDLFVGKPGQEV